MKIASTVETKHGTYTIEIEQTPNGRFKFTVRSDFDGVGSLNSGGQGYNTAGGATDSAMRKIKRSIVYLQDYAE